MRQILCFAFSVLLALTSGQQPCPAENCQQASCNLPDCACAGSEPMNIALNDRPQIVYLSYDDAFTAYAESNFYHELFDGTYTNPNGCPIRATHFISHQYNDYSLMNQYYNMGHEIAAHSITHLSNTTYWKTLSKEGWNKEMVGIRTMLELYGNIPNDAVKGVRAPYLQPGGDLQFQMMVEQGFEYDCSMTNREFGYNNLMNGIWPYSLDYADNQNCQIDPCPTCSYPDIWVQPILDLEDNWYDADGNPEYGEPCDMLDSCIIPIGGDPQQVKDMMMKNFLYAYNGNTRAPIGFYMHAAWFSGQPWHYEGYKAFIEEITTNYNDTWIVPVYAGIQYRRNPVPLSDINDFEPFKCDNFPQAECTPTTCRYNNVTLNGQLLFEINMVSCNACPPEYPWIEDPTGATPPS